MPEISVPDKLITESLVVKNNPNKRDVTNQTLTHLISSSEMPGMRNETTKIRVQPIQTIVKCLKGSPK